MFSVLWVAVAIDSVLANSTCGCGEVSLLQTVLRGAARARDGWRCPTGYDGTCECVSGCTTAPQTLSVTRPPSPTKSMPKASAALSPPRSSSASSTSSHRVTPSNSATTTPTARKTATASPSPPSSPSASPKHTATTAPTDHPTPITSATASASPTRMRTGSSTSHPPSCTIPAPYNTGFVPPIGCLVSSCTEQVALGTWACPPGFVGALDTRSVVCPAAGQPLQGFSNGCIIGCSIPAPYNSAIYYPPDGCTTPSGCSQAEARETWTCATGYQSSISSTAAICTTTGNFLTGLTGVCTPACSIPAPYNNRAIYTPPTGCTSPYGCTSTAANGAWTCAPGFATDVEFWYQGTYCPGAGLNVIGLSGSCQNASGWKVGLGGGGRSCTAICSDYGLTPNITENSLVNTSTLMQWMAAYLNWTCSAYTYIPDDSNAPYLNSATGVCVFAYSTNALASTSAPSDTRVCCCPPSCYLPQDPPPCRAPTVTNANSPSCVQGYWIDSGSTCTPNCTSPNVANYASITCYSASFQPGVFQCAIACSALTTVLNAGSPSCFEGATVLSGSSCTARCAAGYQPTIPTLACSSGTFTPATFTCVLQCPSYSIYITLYLPEYPTHKWISISSATGGGGTTVWTMGAPLNTFTSTANCGTGTPAATATTWGETAVSGFTYTTTYYFNAWDELGDGWDYCTYAVRKSPGGAILINNSGNVPNNGADTVCCMAWSPTTSPVCGSNELMTSEAFSMPLSACPSSCVAPTVSNAPPVSCVEGGYIAAGGTCTAQCDSGYVPIITTLACGAIGGTFTPTTFTCFPGCLALTVVYAQTPSCFEGASIANGLSCTPCCTFGYVPSVSSLACWNAVFVPGSFTCDPPVCAANWTGYLTMGGGQSTSYLWSSISSGYNYTSTLVWTLGSPGTLPASACGQNAGAHTDFPITGLLFNTVYYLNSWYETCVSWNGSTYALRTAAGGLGSLVVNFNGSSPNRGNSICAASWASCTSTSARLIGSEQLQLGCLTQCPAPSVPNAPAIACVEGAYINDGGVCTPRCLAGYTPTTGQLACAGITSGGGGFTPSTFACFPGCFAPTGIANASSPSCTQGSQISNSAVCTSSCAFGTPVPPTLSCNSATLSPSTFVCTALPCFSPTVANAPTPSCTTGATVAQGAVCTTQCNTNYWPSVPSLSCGSTGVLSPLTWTCNKYCTAPTGILYALPVSCLQGTQIQTTCTPQCYQYYSASPASLTCNTGTGVLSPTTFTCSFTPGSDTTITTTNCNTACSPQTCNSVPLSEVLTATEMEYVMSPLVGHQCNSYQYTCNAAGPEISMSSYTCYTGCSASSCSASPSAGYERWCCCGQNCAINTPCQIPTNIVNAAVPPCLEGYAIAAGSTCTPQCTMGLTPTQPSLTCNSGGSGVFLPTSTFACVVPCAAPTVTDAPMPSCVEGSVVATTCTAQCLPGYTFSGSNLTCSGGVLSPSTWTCTPIPWYDWHIGNVSQDCETVCTAYDGVCNQTAMQAIVTEAQLSYVIGTLTPNGYSFYCQSFSTESAPENPGQQYVESTCYNGNGATCSGSDADTIRVCCCGFRCSLS